MIRAHRRRHRALWWALAALLPLLLVAAIRARREIPRQPLPAALAADTNPTPGAGGR
ncbi:MAG: hypothetical protein U0X73_01555 [Thermoanaerobaculia bacterium]